MICININQLHGSDVKQNYKLQPMNILQSISSFFFYKCNYLPCVSIGHSGSYMNGHSHTPSNVLLQCKCLCDETGKHWRAAFQICGEYMLPAFEKEPKSTWHCPIQFPFEVHCLMKPVHCKPKGWFGSTLLLHICAHFCMRRFIETIVQANTTVLFNGRIQILVEPITTCMHCP